MPTVKWIDSAVELPDDDIDVLIAIDDGNTVWVGHHDADMWITNGLPVNVTHWAELPEHPAFADVE